MIKRITLTLIVFTLFTLLTLALPVLAQTCDCSNDRYNCEDFASLADAESCFNYCRDQGRGDVHRLDADSDGLICERTEVFTGTVRDETQPVPTATPAPQTPNDPAAQPAPPPTPQPEAQPDEMPASGGVLPEQHSVITALAVALLGLLAGAGLTSPSRTVSG